MLTEAAPDWLLAFVTALHYSKSNVITFNYDTLLEATVGSLVLQGASTRDSAEQRVLPHALVGDLPPALPVNGGRYGPLDAETFRLFKMHGSTTWFGRGGDDLYSIVRDDRRIGSWTRPAHERPPPVSGMENVIVPPIADKSHLYRNPTIGGIWSEAAAALRSASTVALLGYSLPATDYSAASLIGENAPNSFVVADPYPEGIVERISNLVPDSRIETECAVEEFADAFVARVAAECNLDVDALGSATESSVVVTDALNTRRSVVRIHGTTLEVGEATQRNPPEPSPAVRIGDLRHARNIRVNDGRTAPLLDVVPWTHRGNPIEYKAGVLR